MKTSFTLMFLYLLLFAACSGGEEDRAWNKAQQGSSPEALDSFLMKYPNSSYKEQALSKKGDFFWARAELEKTVYFYRKYAKDYPLGSHVDSIENRIANIEKPEIDLAKLTESMFIGKIDYGNKQIQVLSSKFVQIEQTGQKIDFTATLNTTDYRVDVPGSIDLNSAIVSFEEDPNEVNQLGIEKGRLYLGGSGKWFIESVNPDLYWIIRQN